MTIRYSVVKASLDKATALLFIIITAPIQLAVACLVRLKHGKPVLFKQERPGLHGVPFTLLKFRSMRPYDESRGWTTDEQRLTPLGRFIRAWSIDELPSLINVLKGEMSMVGPRPLLMQYLGLYNPEQARRHEVRPGITGLAQVRGRNSLNWEQKFSLDLEYVENQSLVLDLKILFETVWIVLRRHGVSATGAATMPEFQGNDSAL
jgi:lipopolysaccharide/colanic/teichoic acid biosynthesis glycosyltransferase